LAQVALQVFIVTILAYAKQVVVSRNLRVSQFTGKNRAFPDKRGYLVVLTLYSCIIMWALESEISKERHDRLRFRQLHGAPYLGDLCEYSHKPYISRK